MILLTWKSNWNIIEILTLIRENLIFYQNYNNYSHKFKPLKKLTMRFKDIVQPIKRGIKRGMNRFVSTSYTIADVSFELLKG